jgi:hypothetical protein
VSSTYSVLCLSHDPAITAAYDCGSPEKAAQAIAEGIDGHEHCDLLIGRFSYPLVEAGCPASREQPASLRCIHHGTAWADADVLRLLYAAYRSPDDAVKAAAKAPEFRCWPPERLSRLRGELGIVVSEAVDAGEQPPVEDAEAVACAAYVPPAGRPEDSGCCARCGMYDWKHGGGPSCTATLQHPDHGLIRCNEDHGDWAKPTYHAGPVPGSDQSVAALALRFAWHDHADGATPHRATTAKEA